jgi:hypothetical protein
MRDASPAFPRRRLLGASAGAVEVEHDRQEMEPEPEMTEPQAAAAGGVDLAALKDELDQTLDFIAGLDAQNVKEACEGFGTDDNALTEILCGRSKYQIAKINEAYKLKFGTTLLDEVKSECSGDYLQFLNQMIAGRTEADADALFKAMDGIGTTERVLTEIIVTRSNADLRVLQARYREKFDRPLIDHVKSEVSGKYEDFLVQCLKCERNEGGTPDPALAKKQVAALNKAAKGWGCDESAFIDILGKASEVQTDLIEAEYEKQSGKSLKKLIKDEMSGDLESAMLLRLESPLDAAVYLLRGAMKGMGTNEDVIARVIGGANKDEVQQIHARFDARYTRSLTADLKDELSGNLEKAVLRWVAPAASGYFTADFKSETDVANLQALVEKAYNTIAEIDAVNIKEACAGFGTDDTALTDVVCGRTKKQLRRINEVYKVKFGQTLLDQIKSECSGDYKRFLVRMIAPPVEADSDALFAAMDGMGTTERVLTEIIVTRSNAELEAIKARYQAKFERSLLDHVKSELSGDYEKFLVQCLRCERQEDAAPDPALAATQAAQLAEAAKGWGTNEKVFIDILGKGSVAQIDLIEAEYEKQFSKSLKATIKGEMGGDLESAMLLRLESPLDAAVYLLRGAMKGMGTNEDVIARVIGGANKDEVQQIHARFDARYTRSLTADLKDELSGNLEKAVLKWLAPPQFTEELAPGTPQPVEGEPPADAVRAQAPKEMAKKPNQAALPSGPAGTVPCTIVCPEGATPGSQICVQMHGKTFLISCPAHAAPGKVMVAFLPVPPEGIPPVATPAPPDHWFYVDPRGSKQGPHTTVEMQGWASFFPPTMQVLAPGAATWAPLSTYPQIQAS